MCRQKREKDNEISELHSRIRYLESLQIHTKSSPCNNMQFKYYNTTNNSNSLNTNNNNTYLLNNTNNNLISYSNTNTGDNIPTHKETKEYNLTFNYNMLNNTSNSNLTNNCCESRDPQQSILTNKNSHISGVKYDRVQSQSMDSLINNTKPQNYNNDKNNIGCENINKNFCFNLSGNNMVCNNNTNCNKNLKVENSANIICFEDGCEKEVKNTELFLTFENVNKGDIKNLETNLSDVVIPKSNTDGKIVSSFTLQDIKSSNNKNIHNFCTNKSIFLHDSLENIKNEGNEITHISLIDEKEKDTSIGLLVVKLENNNENNKNYSVTDINFKNLQKDKKSFEINENKMNKSNNDYRKYDIGYKSKIEIENSSPKDKKIANYDDLDDIVFPDKVKMRSVSLKKILPKLHLDFNNKSLDLRKHKKVLEFPSNDYTDSYNIDLDKTSFILNDKFKGRVLKFFKLIDIKIG